MKKLLFIALLFCLSITNAQTIATPAICMVTTDTLSNNNVIYWDKTGYQHIDSFIVYREVTVSSYARIGAQPYNALSKFVDTARSVGPANGDPITGAYRYLLQMRDSSGNYSALSPFHTTVYLTNNSTGQFFWNYYTVEGSTVTPVTYFSLMRDDNSTGHFVAISSVSGTQTTQADPNYSTYAATATWRLDAFVFNCSPTLRSTQAAVATISHSNPVYGQVTGIAKINTANKTSIYPNPATNKINVTANDISSLKVFDVIGKEVISTKVNDVDVSNLPNGVYFIQVQTNQSTTTQKIIVQH